MTKGVIRHSAKQGKIIKSHFYSVRLWILLASCFTTMPGYALSSVYQVKSLSESLHNAIEQYTWHAGCPIPLKNLSQLNVTYWGLDGKTHSGSLIVNTAFAPQLGQIFTQLYAIHFPFAKIIPLVFYQGNEAEAMADNDTFAFHCRAITGNAHIFSRHAYGAAIDINPLFNPYIKDNVILPPAGKAYLSRTLQQPGLIAPDAKIVNIFQQAGWQWGGDWHSLQDYQHFEIP